MTQKQIDDLGLMIDNLEGCAATWLKKARSKDNVKETAILEEAQWLAHNVKAEFKLGNFAEAKTLYEYTEWLVNRSIRRMANN